MWAFVRDDRGVDSVIGSVLMLAIVVILVGIVSTTVFGMGNQVIDSGVNAVCQVQGEIGELANSSPFYDGGDDTLYSEC